MAKQLYEETPEPKSIWLVPEVDHNNLPDVAGAELQEQLRQFFQRYLNLQP
jgi:fermentation-respiration switch protein FrsA (DUF1100 family)